MALFIGDDSVRELAERLVEGRRTTVYDAIKQALERELARKAIGQNANDASVSKDAEFARTGVVAALP